jgi:predicted unusual protein kinase regulating ubiquinone biosynthesis (AarF/ABC1/UbiB family)
MPALNSPNSASTLSGPAEPASRVHWRRYWRTLRFGAWLFARVITWELLIRRLVGDHFVAAHRPARLRQWAREYRTLAVEMGGVMIKLGQFVSSRVDVLPPEITQELASLQDEVPTVPFDVIRQTLEEDLGPQTTHFASFNTEPVAAASLGQAHRAQLLNGERVVVKIQRPGIRNLVYTDLKALAVIAGWVMKWRFIARRANVPALLDEFSAGLWEELDYYQEADHAERFARLFAEDRGVYIPRLYRGQSTRRVLTLEDVTAIKITDYARIEAAGVDRREVARRLLNTYLMMIFVEQFFHADPHPGNLFVYPMPPGAPASDGQHNDGQTLQGRPFYLVFVDFGMVGRLTPEIVSGLRETLIALTMRDARRLVQAYQRLGILLPGADLGRIEEATRAAFDKVWGLNMAQLSGMKFGEMVELGREFSDLLLALPFQVPQDFLYLARAVGILSGMCTGLDPQFDPWHEMQPFVNRLLVETGEIPPHFTPFGLNVIEGLRLLLTEDAVKFLLDTGRRTIQLPALADSVLHRADRGELTIRVADMEQQVHVLENAIRRLVSAVMFTGLSVCTVLLYTAGEKTLSAAGLVLTAFTFLRVVLGNSRGA